MFPNQFTLCINKCLKNEEDKTYITQLNNELFNKNNIHIDVLKLFQVIANMKDLQTTNNICYYNYRKLSTRMKRRKKEMVFYHRKSILLKMKISYIILVWF